LPARSWEEKDKGEKRLSSDAERAPFEDPVAGAAIARPPSRKRRLIVLLLAIVLVVAGAAVAVAPWLYSSNAALAAISAQIQEATGLYVAARGKPRLSFAPRPHISIEGVGFADRNGALVIEAEEFFGGLKLLPLLSGRLEVDSISLTRPRIEIDLERKPIDAPGAAARAAAAQPASPEANKVDNFRLGVLNILDGALRLKLNEQNYVAEKISATLDWRKVGEPATLTGAFDWRGERLQLILWIARPAILLRGDPSVAVARLDGESVRLEAQGVAQTGPNAHYAGHVAGSAASVREALDLFDLHTPLPGPFGDAQASAQAVLSAREAVLKDLQISVDGNAFEGELALRNEEGKPRVSATLKSGFVALKPMLADAPALIGPDGQWSHERLAPPDLSGADLDLSVIARHARLGRLTIDDASVSVTLRDGGLDVSLLEAQAYRGKLKARASFKPAGDALAVHASAQTAGVDARALLWDILGSQALGGALDSSLKVDAAGATIADMMHNLNGRASLNMSDGEITGVDFERALHRFEKRPLASAQDIRSGSSALEKASATLLFENGIGALDDGSAHGPGFALRFGGTANLAERTLSLKAAAQQADATGRPRDKGLQIAFDLAGGWDELSLAPDPRAFIRRSGAAAPLLPDPPPEEDR
jgi:AsmA protein